MRKAVRKLRYLILACLLTTGIRPAVAGTVTVSFIHPENYTGASLQGRYETKADRWTLDQIGRYLESLGGRLGPQQVLTLDVLNVDLAGKSSGGGRTPTICAPYATFIRPELRCITGWQKAGGPCSKARRRS